jgi:hypothetical protein
LHSAIHGQGRVLGRKAHSHGHDIGVCVPARSQAGRVDLGGEHVDHYSRQRLVLFGSDQLASRSQAPKPQKD